MIMYQGLEELYRDDSNFNKNGWAFPKDIVEPESNIILYGAGKVGNFIKKQLEISKYCNVILWIDKNSNLPETNSNISSVREVSYDYIVIAIANPQIIEKVKNELLEMGVEEGKIVSGIGGNHSNIEKAYLEINDKLEKTKWNETHENIIYEQPYSVTSMICNQSFFDMPFAQYWGERTHECFVHLMRASNQYWDGMEENNISYHRKLWEFIYICQALFEREMLREGKKGIVFGVGEECLPDLFASMGCKILATDLNENDAKKVGWQEDAQNAAGDYWKLNQYGFCDKETFQSRVEYRDVNMNDIPEDLHEFDFCWSACALEHLGNLQCGMDFVKNSLKVLKTGGIAVHTTEFNLISNDKTLETKDLSIYRKQDIEKLIEELQREGHTVFPMDWHIGEDVCDQFVDVPPFSKNNVHLRLLLENYPSTSIGIIIKKGK